MAGWHHWLDGRESEWTPGVGDGQGGLVCCDSWGRKESDATDWLNWTKYGDRIPAELFKILKDDAVKVLHSTCQQIWKTQQWPQDWKRSVFIPIPKKGNAKGRWNYHIIALISHARLQQYMNKELPDVQAVFWRGRGTTDQIVNICGVMEKAREFQKNIYFCFIDYAKAFDCVDHHKLWRILKEMGIPASWETWMQIRKQQLELDMEKWTGSKLGKEYVKAVYCHLARVHHAKCCARWLTN